MKRAFYTTVTTLLPLLAALAAPPSTCQAWCEWMDCDACWCHCCNFRFVDGCTLCAWHRTWHGPNALATPLRQYFVPRPPQCCYSRYNGYGNGNGCCIEGCGYTVGEGFVSYDESANENPACTPGPALQPSAANGFAGAQFERLGEVRNELDVLGPSGTTVRGAAPAR